MNKIPVVDSRSEFRWKETYSRARGILIINIRVHCTEMSGKYVLFVKMTLSVVLLTIHILSNQ